LFGAIEIPDCSCGECFDFFEHCQSCCEVFAVLGLAQEFGRLQQGYQQCLYHTSRSYYPCGDAVDAGVEEVEADMCPVEIPSADQFGCEGL